MVEFQLEANWHCRAGAAFYEPGRLGSGLHGAGFQNACIGLLAAGVVRCWWRWLCFHARPCVPRTGALRLACSSSVWRTGRPLPSSVRRRHCASVVLHVGTRTARAVQEHAQCSGRINWRNFARCPCAKMIARMRIHMQAQFFKPIAYDKQDEYFSYACIRKQS